MRLCFFRFALIPTWLLHACTESPVAEESEQTTDPAAAVGDGSALAPLDAAGTVDALDAGVAMPPSASDAATASDAVVGRVDQSEDPDARAATVASDAAVAKLDARVLDASVARPDLAGDAAMAEASVPPPMCTMPGRLCGTRCIDTRSDLMNCGECGRRCGSGESCIASRCWAPPPEGCASRIHEGRAYLFCNQERPWRAARESCLGARMDLLIVDDAAENEFARGIGAVSWLGANDLANEGTFRWPTAGSADRPNGAALMGGYSNWLPDEPNNTRRCDGVPLGGGCLGRESDEDCVELNTEGRWNDFECERGRRYVCESY